jgi:alpha-L-fucosidase
MARWMAVNGEGIYSTRPWKISGEGPSAVVIEGFREDAVPWTIEDFRFTSKGKQVYAFMMKWPEGGRTVVRSLALGAAGRVADVALLGYRGPVKFEQTARGLAVDLPDDKPSEFAQCLRITLE